MADIAVGYGFGSYGGTEADIDIDITPLTPTFEVSTVAIGPPGPPGPPGQNSVVVSHTEPPNPYVGLIWVQP